MHLYFYVTFKKKSYYLRHFTQKKSRNISWKHRSMKNSALEMISFHCVHICFLVAYLWSTPQSIHLFAHFILFHYIACLKDLKIYHHFDYNHTTSKESIFFLTKPCRTLFFFMGATTLGDTQCANLVCWHKTSC